MEKKVNKYKHYRRKRNLFRTVLRLLIIIAVIGGGSFAAFNVMYGVKDKETSGEELKNLMVNSSAGKENAQLNYILKNKKEFSDELISLANRNEEAIQFVYDYPENKDKSIDISIKDEIKEDKVPLFLQ